MNCLQSYPDEYPGKILNWLRSLIHSIPLVRHRSTDNRQAVNLSGNDYMDRMLRSVSPLCRQVFLLKRAMKEAISCKLNWTFWRPHVNKHERHREHQARQLISSLNQRVRFVVIPENVSRMTTDRDRTFWKAFLDGIERYCRTKDKCRAFDGERTNENLG
jgi:hypothetical protein